MNSRAGLVRPAAALAIAALLVSTAAFAQTSPGPPGPYIFDVRGTMSGVPSASTFHPGLPGAALVPKRAFGLGFGAHVYLFKLGPARVGLGVDVANMRGVAKTPAGLISGSTTTTAGTTPTPASTTTATPPPVVNSLDPTAAIRAVNRISVVAPQISFNFGTRDGWSYLSAGYGSARIEGEASGQAARPASGPLTITGADVKRADAINYGGGARWFIKEHLAVGFDLRFHLISASGTQPSAKTFVMSVGVSVR